MGEGVVGSASEGWEACGGCAGGDEACTAFLLGESALEAGVGDGEGGETEEDEGGFHYVWGLYFIFINQF